MSGLVIEYDSSDKRSDGPGVKLLETSSKSGLHWEWRYFTELATKPHHKQLGHFVYLSWTFKWNEKEMERRDIEGFIGDCTAYYQQNRNSKMSWVPMRFSMKLTHSGQCIRKKIGSYKETEYCSEQRVFQMDFTLNSVKPKVGISIDSKFYDAGLNVEGKKIHVNKNYLAFRSEFFDKLFNSDFKEKSINEIPIKEVKYRDFKLFLDMIHPTKPAIPNDDDVEMLLKLADRFLVPAVTRHVENHLLNNSELSFKAILKIADTWKLEELLEHSLGCLSKEDLELFFKTFNQEELSDATRLKLLNRIENIFDEL